MSIELLKAQLALKQTSSRLYGGDSGGHETTNASESVPQADWARRVAKVATTVSKPFDWFSRGCTDGVLIVKDKLFRREDSLTQDNALMESRVDLLFPVDALKQLDQLKPGIYDLWFNKLSQIAEETKYAYARTLFSAITDGFVTGLASGSSAGIATVGIGRVLSSIVTGSVDVFALQHYNQLWGLQQAFAADIRSALRNSKDVVNADQLVGAIFMGQFESIKYELSTIKVWALLMGLTIGIGSSSLLSRDPFNLYRSAVVGGYGAATILALGKFFPKLIADLSSEFGKIQADLVDKTEEGEKWAMAVGDLVGDSDHVMGLSIQREQATRAKNLTTRSASGSLPSFVALLMHEAGAGDLAANSFALMTLISEVIDRNGLYMTYVSRVASRERAIQKLQEVIQQLLSGDRAPLTKRALEKWMSPESQEAVEENIIKKDKLKLHFGSVGVPCYQRGQHEELIDKVAFTQNFTISSGQIIGVIGGNASGKTTLFKTLDGTHVGAPEKTDVTWNDVDLRSMDPELRARKFIFLKGMSGSVDLRSLAVKVVSNWEVGESFDQEKLRNFIRGRSYPELELLIINHFKNSNLLPQFDASWLSGNRKFSGYEQTMLEIGIYLLISEPVVLMVDEAGGALTGKNYQLMVNRLCGAVAQSRHALLVGVNKDIFRWYSRDELVGWIRMNDSVQGFMLADELDQGSLITQEMGTEIAAELQASHVSTGLLLEPKLFLTWAKHEESLTQYRHEIAEFKLHYPDRAMGIARKTGLTELETGEIGEYVQKCLVKWLNTLKDIEGNEKFKYLHEILLCLNNFYGLEFQHSGFLRRTTNELVISQWPDALTTLFDEVVWSLVEEACELVSKASKDDNKDEDLRLCYDIFKFYKYFDNFFSDEGRIFSTKNSKRDLYVDGHKVYPWGIKALCDGHASIVNAIQIIAADPLYQRTSFTPLGQLMLVKRIEGDILSIKDLNELVELLKTIYMTYPWGERVILWDILVGDTHKLGMILEHKRLEVMATEQEY